MSTITRLLISALPLLVLASCGKDDTDGRQPGGEPSGGGERIEFEIGFAPMTRVATDGQFKSTWEEGDEIGVFGVFINDSAEPIWETTGNPIHNAKLTYSGGKWTGDIYWPADSEMDGEKLHIYAYYPYNDNGGAPQDLDPESIPFGVATDQRGQTEHNRSDLLFAWSAHLDKGETVSLQFRHLLAMVELTLDNANKVIDPSKELSVTLKDIYAGGKLDLNDHFFTPDPTSDPVDIIMHRVEQPGTTQYNETYTFRAFVPAQELDAGERKFVIDNEDIILQSSELTNAVTLKAQQAERFTQTLPWSATRSQAEANSYMVEPNSAAILIPVSQANRVLDGDGLGATTDGLNRVKAGNFRVELVWADTDIALPGSVLSDAVPDGDYIKVTPGNTPGNAVIGIKLNGETDYRWSWHIWVTEPVTSATDTETGLTWMDRNLGAKGATWATGAGLHPYYQWGRKDAFPGGDGTSNNQTYHTPSYPNGTNADIPTGTYTELPDMVRNPLNFATNLSTYRGSVNAEDNNNSWGGETRKKTVYDPCPPGWRVPLVQTNGYNSWGSSGDWDSWNDSGRLFKGVNGTANLGHYYPASGFRHTSYDGQLHIQGTQGYYWSATASAGNTGYRLHLSSGGVGPANSLNRSYGFTVRCVADI